MGLGKGGELMGKNGRDEGGRRAEGEEGGAQKGKNGGGRKAGEEGGEGGVRRRAQVERMGEQMEK